MDILIKNYKIKHAEPRLKKKPELFAPKFGTLRMLVNQSKSNQSCANWKSKMAATIVSAKLVHTGNPRWLPLRRQNSYFKICSKLR